jgi:uncharacterized membrane protein (DUF485 family)
MSNKNKIYWLEGVTEKGTRALLTDENSNFKWLRSQRNRRVLVVIQMLGLALIALGSYYPALKAGLNLTPESEIAILVAFALLVVLMVLGGYTLLRVAVRGIADAPDELLDERQIQVRNTSFRYAYFSMGYLVLALLLLMFFGPDLQLFGSEGNDGSYLMIATLFAFASAPSMILAWREKDI